MEKVLSNFKIYSKIISCSPYGEGHINETYLLNYENDGDWTGKNIWF